MSERRPSRRVFGVMALTLGLLASSGACSSTPDRGSGGKGGEDTGAGGKGGDTGPGTGGNTGAGGKGGDIGTGGNTGVGGSGGGTGTGGNTGAGGSGGSSGMPCTTEADCPAPANECVLNTCVGGICGTENAAAGTPTSMQTASDCKQNQCDGNGSIISANDDTDVMVDNETCTQDLCSNGTASNPPVNVGTACSEGTGKLCDAAGQCVACLVATDCAGTDTECQQRTCDAGACGMKFTAAGTPLAMQTAGDCLTATCDGAGATTTKNDDADLPNDNNACTSDLCSNGAASHMNAADGTACGAGLTCTNGACGGCTMASDCPGTDDECKTRTCTTGSCGFNFTANGTAVAMQTVGDCKKQVCDGAGNTVSNTDNTDVPADDGNACTTDTCVAGAPSHPNKPGGVSCPDDGDACTLDACNGTGTCSHPAAPNGTSCGAQLVCQAGSCVPACTEITLGAFIPVSFDGSVGTYAALATPNKGAAEQDQASVQFYGSGVDPSFNGEQTGTFNLASGGDNNYSTCSRCVLLLVDPSAPGKIFFQQSGTMVVNAGSDQLNGVISTTLTDVKLIEVTINNTTFVSTPVPNGECVHIASATISQPNAWTCDPSYYNDGACDCGCGIFDVDCLDNTVDSCEYCDDPGSCSIDSCPGTIDPANNAECTP